MFSEEIRVCLEQKSILLTKILNLTKQIEVRCNEPEIKLEHFFEQRGGLMQRVDKCNHLIEAQLSQLPQEEQARVRSILNLTAEENDCSEEEKTALELVRKCDSLYRRAAALNQSANDAMKRQYETVKSKIKEMNPAGKGQSLFQKFR